MKRTGHPEPLPEQTETARQPEFHLIEWGSPAYHDELALRDEELRRPLGLRIRDDDLSDEPLQTHVGAFVGGRLAGVLILAPGSEGTLRMRQVAVRLSLRGRGIGTRLVRFAEGIAAARGCRHIVLHARKTAVPFYERLGYRAEGAKFTEVTIPHRAMSRELR